MANVVVMPRAGQTMEEGSIVEWLKKEGDTVKAGEPLVIIMSDKANLEIESDYSGVLKKILITEEDGDIDCLTPIAIIGEPDEEIDVDAILAAHK
jgi:pyruvate/2-oxoglutarate dehydrogenase complex dihydrolipoamide acyltransferase (E2) component